MPLNFKKIPVVTTTELRKAFEKQGFLQDEDNHKHIKMINKEGHEFILVKGNKTYTKAVIRDIVFKFAEHKGITPEEALKLLLGKK